MRKLIWHAIIAVGEKSPLAHSITNFMMINNKANAYRL